MECLLHFTSYFVLPSILVTLSVGCNHVSLPLITASGTEVVIYFGCIIMCQSNLLQTAKNTLQKLRGPRSSYSNLLPQLYKSYTMLDFLKVAVIWFVYLAIVRNFPSLSIPFNLVALCLHSYCIQLNLWAIYAGDPAKGFILFWSLPFNCVQRVTMCKMFRRVWSHDVIKCKYFPRCCDTITWKHFRVTGPLWGESTGHRWIPLKKASDAELCWFLYVRLNEQLRKQSTRRWFETPWQPLWRQCNVIRSI